MVMSLSVVLIKKILSEGCTTQCKHSLLDFLAGWKTFLPSIQVMWHMSLIVSRQNVSITSIITGFTLSLWKYFDVSLLLIGSAEMMWMDNLFRYKIESDLNITIIPTLQYIEKKSSRSVRWLGVHLCKDKLKWFTWTFHLLKRTIHHIPWWERWCCWTSFSQKARR